MSRKRRVWRQLSIVITAVSLIAFGSAPVATASDHGNRSGGPPRTDVLDWNQYALEALANSPTAAVKGAGQSPPVSAPHLAMVHGAVYSAVTSIHDQRWSGHRAHARASESAAVSAAAYNVLIGVMADFKPPLAVGVSAAIRERLDDQFTDSKAAATKLDGAEAVDAGIAVGSKAAADMLDNRKNDGRYGTFRFPDGDSVGEWRLDPRPAVPFDWVAKVDPFTVKSTDQFQSSGPYDLDSRAYARDYREVKELGAKTLPGPAGGTPRNAAQEAVAQFYNVHAVELFNRTFRTVATTESLSLTEQARLFAMLNTATADSLITCWEDKAHWNFWRPIAAIQQGDADGNRWTVGDPTWVPLEPTPPYPDHSSGFNCISAAMIYSAKAFFGTNRMEFDVVRIAPPPAAGQPAQPNVTRHYSKLTDVVQDTIDARVFQGIHFRNADVQGAKIGENVARWVSRSYR